MKTHEVAGGEAGAEGAGQVAGESEAGPPAGGGEAWRGRALAAEGAVKSLESRVTRLGAELEAARAAMEGAARRHELERRLAEARALDAESAGLLVEEALRKEPAKDVARAVAEVRQRKPHLFEAAGGVGSVASGAMPAESRGGVVEEALVRARSEGGTRRSLMDYLRAKRRGV